TANIVCQTKSELIHLTRHEPEPRSEVTTPAKCAAIADRGDQRCCVQHADAGDGGQAICGGVAARHLSQLPIQCSDPRINRAPLIEHVIEQGPHTWAEAVPI